MLVVSRDLVEHVSRSLFSMSLLSSSRVIRYYTLDESVRGLHENYYSCVVEWQYNSRWQQVDLMPNRGHEQILRNIVSLALSSNSQGELVSVSLGSVQGSTTASRLSVTW